MAGGYIGTAPADRDPTVGNEAITTAKLADDAVTVAKLANAINTDIDANTAKTGITSGQTSAITANTAKVTNVTTDLALTSDATSVYIIVNKPSSPKIIDSSLIEISVLPGVNKF